MTEENTNLDRMKKILVTMIKAGVFDVINGKVELNFDSKGDLMNIKVEQQIYKKIKICDHDKKIQTADKHTG